MITGTDFTGTTAVTFGGVAATSYTVDSDTQITAVTPAGTGTVTVAVTTASGTGTSVGTFGYLPAPSISGLVPTSGPEAGGTSVVITGSAFTGATDVSFGATPATSFTVDSPTQITAITPAGTGVVSVSVTTAYGTAVAFGTFTYVPVPTITTLAPTTGPEVGGTTGVITGSGFTGTTAVSFGGTAATFVVDSDTQITAVSPAGVSAVTVSVTTIGGTATSVGTFTYVPNVSGGGSGGGGGTVTVTRIGGPDRDATANLISQAMFPTAHSAKVVILARDDIFADALAGSPMSNVFAGPVLLTPSTSLGASAQDGIVRALNPGDTVYVLGGTTAINDSVVAHINRARLRHGAHRRRRPVCHRRVDRNQTVDVRGRCEDLPGHRSQLPRRARGRKCRRL